LKKEFNILKKPYLPPRVEFEEIEADEREMLMASVDDGTGGDPEEGDGDDDIKLNSPHSLDLDFVINDEPLQ
jgi:hypothetical protein